jgi:toxin ParE1/3/4
VALRVDRAPRAYQDERDIFLTIAADNLSAAERFLGAIYDAEDRLSEFPQLGRSRGDLGPNIRSWTVEPYLIFYVLEPEAVVILRILHGSRDLREALSEA